MGTERESIFEYSVNLKLKTLKEQISPYDGLLKLSETERLLNQLTSNNEKCFTCVRKKKGYRLKSITPHKG